MAYQNYTDEGSTTRTRRRRTTSSQTTTYRKRRRKRNPIRFDLIFLAAIALVVVLVIAMPQQTPQPTDPVGTTDGAPLSIQGTTEPATKPATDPPTEPFAPVPVTFTAADAELIYVRSYCDGRADVEEAMLAPLDWDLTDPNFTVLIIHSHVSESYTLTAGEAVNESSSFTGDPYRTDDERYNMIPIGQKVAEILRANGINVIHDTTSFEIPNSDYAYSNGREHLEQVLAENPNIGLILDIHRDAVENSDGSQWAPTVTVDGQEASKLSMLIGYPGSYDSYWDQNLSFAVKLGAQINHEQPEMFRQLVINESRYHYNQNMGPVSMLIEVGTAGNSFQEAMNAAEVLGEAIVDLAYGANVEE